MIKFITSNEHKFQEVSARLAEAGIDIEWMKMAYEEIQADDTGEISLDSAKKISQLVEGPFFLEDTGLYIDSLGGFPGPYSSFVSRKIGNAGILRLVDGKARDARFVTVITYSDGRNYHQFTGVLEGEISPESRGDRGFGFDPIFIPYGMEDTLAQMDIGEKNSISHRSMALEQLISFFSV